jgi:coenzyme F420 hydrogenase subunit beta
LECRDCLDFCPGYRLDGGSSGVDTFKGGEAGMLVGPSLQVWEGFASDGEVRYRGSSGGVLTALSLYCLEKEGMGFVLHTGMDPAHPWRNLTVVSRTREELLDHAGSRYTPSSPCDALRKIEESESPCVFIGKPCDTAAVTMLRKIRPSLDRKLGLVLTFFCAGPPCSEATASLVKELGQDPGNVRDIRYRGHGWPGFFTVRDADGVIQKQLTYKESWGYLAERHRSFRCHLCPDGMGELADISSGDAWHLYRDDGNPGESVVLARTSLGLDVVRRAIDAGYLDLHPSSPERVISGQGLGRRRAELYGRLTGLRLFGVPTPEFPRFPLKIAWTETVPVLRKARVILGTAKRIILRGLWHRNPVFPVGGLASRQGASNGQ